jgi:hypothetical protein
VSSSLGVVILLGLFAALMAYTKTSMSAGKRRVVEFNRRGWKNIVKLHSWLELNRDCVGNYDKMLERPEIRAILTESVSLFDELIALDPSLEKDRGFRDYIANILENKK